MTRDEAIEALIHEVLDVANLYANEPGTPAVLHSKVALWSHLLDTIICKTDIYALDNKNEPSEPQND